MTAATSHGEEVANTPPTASKRDDADAILDVVLQLLDDGGDEGLQLREVAKQARVSLSTVYKYFPSRDELVIAAVERWMAERVYAALPMVGPEEPLADRLTRWFGQLLAPWAEQPNMLRVFMRAALLPDGERLTRQGEQSAGPSAVHLFDGYEPRFVADVVMILTNVIQGLLNRFASGQIGMEEVAEDLERTIHRLADGVQQQQPEPTNE
jgi:TetR/AcrR family transcriptional regulator, cholesterol catabolism regulator